MTSSFKPQPHDSPAPRKVLYLWDAEYPWDIRVQKICQSLTDAGHEVVIAARNRRWEARTSTSPEGCIFRMRPWSVVGKRLDSALSFPVFFNPRWLAFLWSSIRKFRPDVVVVRDLPLSLTAAWVCRWFKVPVILDMAENYPAMIQLIWDTGRAKALDRLVRNPRAVYAVERYALPRMDRVWVDVEEQEDRLRAIKIPLPPIDVVRNTPPIARLGPPRTSATSRTDVALEVVYLGILELQRGVGELLEAVARLRDDGTRVRVAIIGGGRDETLFRDHAAKLGLGSDLAEFLGFVPNADAVVRVAQADVGANPIHRNEKHDTTLPNKLFDYMAAGLPVLTSDSTPSARVVHEHQCGEVFRSGDVTDLVRALKALLPGEARIAMGARGQQAVRELFHWEHDAISVVASVNEVTRR